MPRHKKGLAASIKASHRAQKRAQNARKNAETTSSMEGPSAGLPQSVSSNVLQCDKQDFPCALPFRERQTRIKAELEMASQASQVPLPEDNPGDFESTIEILRRRNQAYVQRWRDIGYYERHPNHNESEVLKMKKAMKKHKDYNSIKEKYKLFVNTCDKHLMLLQYPNREPGQAYCDAVGQKPLELRIKPKCGLVEIDVPIDIHANYDKVKGLEFGAALRKNKLKGGDGSFGVAGGLGVDLGNVAKTRGAKEPQNQAQSYAAETGMRAPDVGPTFAGDKDNRKNAVPEGPSREKLLENFEDANNKGHVMNKITLGGRIVPFKNGDPIYMVATFKDGKFYSQ